MAVDVSTSIGMGTDMFIVVYWGMGADMGLKKRA